MIFLRYIGALSVVVILPALFFGCGLMALVLLADFLTTHPGLQNPLLTVFALATGFTAVSVATLCLPTNHRAGAAWGLTAAGVLVYVLCWRFAEWFFTQKAAQENAFSLPFFPWLLAGGLSASAFFVLRRFRLKLSAN